MFKKYFLHVLAIATILTSAISFSFAQNASQVEQIYKVSIEPIDQQSVKPLIGILMPVFNQVPFLEQGNYEHFYYKVSGNLDSAVVRDLLQNTKYVLLDIAVVDKKVYDKIINQNQSPKN